MGDFKQLLKDIGTTKIIAIAVAIFVVMVGFFFLTTKFTASNLVPIYNELDYKDAAQIARELDSKGVQYEIRANGTQILVPENQMLKLRLDMAALGIPNKGSIVGYEIFDKGEAFGTSNFIQNVNLLRALEGELGRTIASFQNIDSARVHLVVPKRELFQRDKQAPTASVVVRMRGSAKLNKEEVNSISNLVATAVPGLDISKITIVDNKGRSLKAGASDPNDLNNVGSMTTEDYRNNIESRYSHMIEDILSRSLGEGKVNAKVTAEINFDRIVTNSEIFDPEGQVVRSIQAHNEKENSFSNKTGQVSVENNLPETEVADNNPDNGTNIEKTDEITNFEISKKIVNHISESGTIKRLSIAVLVDGVYKKKEDGGFEYTPRSEEELKKVETLVKSTVGFDVERKDKIEIINMQFITDLDMLKDETTSEWIKRELPSIIQSLVIGIVVIFVLLFIVRPVAIRAFELHKYEEEEATEFEEIDVDNALNAKIKEQMDADLDLGNSANDNDDKVDIDIMSKKFKSGALKTINDFATKYPEETVSILRSWLSKE